MNAYERGTRSRIYKSLRRTAIGLIAALAAVILFVLAAYRPSSR